MTFSVEFEELNQEIDVDFGEVNNISDGGFERGYAAGYESGNSEGYNDGYADGTKQGYTNGYEIAIAKSADIIQRKITEYENNDITSVGAYAFHKCEQLKKAILPNLKSCGDYAFNATSIEAMDYPELTSVGSYAFSNNGAIKYVNLPKVITISGSAFRSDGELEIADFESVTSIGNMAFYFCKKLSTVIIRTNELCTIGSNCFAGTLIDSGNGFIYVLDNLVEQCKTFSNWSTYASQIKPLSELE